MKSLIFLLIIFLFSPKAVFAQNLLQNPGFEEPLFNWEASSGLNIAFNFTVSSYVKKSGVYSALIKHDKTGSYGAQQIIRNIMGEDQYLGKGYVFFNDKNAKNAKIRIAWYSSDDGSGSQMGTVDSNIIDTTLPSWQELDTGVIKAPTTAKSAEFRILLASSEKVESFVYFDDLSFEKVTLPPPTSSPTPTPTLPLTPTLMLPPTLTSSPAISDYDNIFISEFMAYPESGDEWVELFNDNDFEVNILGWYIDDIANDGSSPIPISGTISPGGYKQFFLSSAYLNNGGDDARLLKGSQQEKDKKSFESSIKGKSWVKDKNGNWCQSEPTPNEANPDCPSSEVNSTQSPTPTPIKKITPTPTTKVTQSLATKSGEVLGEEVASFSAFYPYEATDEAEKNEATPSARNKILPKIFLIGGLLLLFASACWVWYNFVRNYRGKHSAEV